MSKFEQTACEVLHAQFSGNYTPTNGGGGGADYQDEYGTVLQLISTSDLPGYIQERRADNFNPPLDDEELQIAVKECTTILIDYDLDENNNRYSTLFAVINCTTGEMK